MEFISDMGRRHLRCGRCP